MLCELCGKETPLTSRIRIEGTILNVGPECVRFGERIDPPPSPSGAATAALRPRPGVGPVRPAGGRRLEERDLYQEIGEMELAPDWPKRVRTAREARTWTPEDLGKKLNEKKSVVLKIESGNFRPPDDLVRKLERLLQVRLRAEAEPASSG